jgi:hypothetical protein
MKNFGLIAFIGVAAFVVLVIYYFSNEKSNDLLFNSDSAVSHGEFYVSALGKTYENQELRFSLTMPEGFQVREVKDRGIYTIVLEDTNANGIQVVATPFDEDIRELTPAMINADLPDLEITNPQPVEIGETHKGLAFLSNNEAYDGSSREVWFVFAGHLYQISTYAHLDNLLQAMFGTWKFQ